MAAILAQQKEENEMFVYSVSHDLRRRLSTCKDSARSWASRIASCKHYFTMREFRRQFATIASSS